ncbi:MAG: YihY/virulence factor BrkB family protein [Ktedonobacterales bacterium]
MDIPSANNAAAPGVRIHEMPPASYTLPEKRDQREFMQELLAFWKKINNDWIFNLAGLLAYNFLLALFPILLLLIAGLGIVLNHTSPQTEQTLEQYVASALPQSVGNVIVQGVTTHLKESVGPLLLVGIVTSLITGSRLFLSLENCFGIIFRLRGRTLLRQTRMAFGMLLLYLVLLPVLFLISILPADIINLFDLHRQSAIGGPLLTASRILVGFMTAFVLFGATYMFVPHRLVRWRSWQRNWRGALVAAVLLIGYELLFPLYEQLFLHADNYGSVAGFAVVILLFFYYIAFILLLGAEINSWAAGQRETAADLPGMLHAVQAHRSVLGAAGPTAGQPDEEMQHIRRLPRASRYLLATIEKVRHLRREARRRLRKSSPK